MNSPAPHILCVNPWIHDFAAFDFWAKPLGLLQIVSVLREYGVNVSYLDCTDRFHPNEVNEAKVAWDGRGPYRKKEIPLPPLKGLEKSVQKFSRYGIEPEWFRQDLKELKTEKKVDLIFVTSLMTYWASGVEEAIKIIREVFPSVPLVLGGIYASLCSDHAEKYSGADLVVQGSGFKNLNKIVKDYTRYDMGFEYNSDNLDKLPYPAFDMQSRITYAPVLTSIGCPFNCEYCASSYLAPDFYQRSVESVFHEIEHWYHKYEIKNFAFYDDALLINGEKHAFPLFERIIESDMDVWFHTPNAIHIKEVTKRAASLMYKAGFKTIRLGLETTDFEHRRFDTKVRKGEFYIALENLKKAGFHNSQIGAYLLCGLPGQRFESVQDSFIKVKESGIKPALAFYTPIPHTKMWEKAKNYSKYDIEKDPLYTNNTLFPCVFEKDITKKIARMKNL